MYIYLGKYFHRHGTDMSNIVERKIGKTNNLNRREYELNDTKMTIGYTVSISELGVAIGRGIFYTNYHRTVTFRDT